jgi:cell division septation protein DedD
MQGFFILYLILSSKKIKFLYYFLNIYTADRLTFVQSHIFVQIQKPPMKIFILIVILLYLPSITFGRVIFFQGSLNEVQRTAALEGKLYFIDFYAAYCLPCKLMDQTTFMDPELGEYIKGNYLPLKLDIKAFDAYEVRNKHEVNLLPTVMIFSSKGELLESYEGSLTASKLREMLEKHNIPQNRQRAMPPPTESTYAGRERVELSRKPIDTNLPPNKPEPKEEQVMEKPVRAIRRPDKPILESVIDQPVLTITEPINQVLTVTDNIIFEEDEISTSTFSTVNPKMTLSIPKLEPVQESKPIAINTLPEKPIQAKVRSKVTGLYEFTATPHPAKGFAVQIGVFAEYSNVLNGVEHIQELFSGRKVIIHIDEIDGETVYRVVVGTFTSSAAARSFMPQIKAEGFEGFVKDLSTLK